MIRLKLIKVYSLCLALLPAIIPATATALPDDRSKPIHITSDTAEVDDKTGSSVYRGKVKMVQGSINLEGDQITIFSNANGVTRLVAIGVPAHFQQLPEVGKNMTHAYGNTIEYFVVDEKMNLKKQARLEQDTNVFTGERIDYDMKQRLVNAYGGSENNSTTQTPRVNMIIQPATTSDNQSSSSTNE
jgi:lipopolysaccharide export system protein LptA